MSLTSLFALLCLACTADPPAATVGAPTELSAAGAVAVADLDGDGEDDVVLVQDGAASWAGREADLGGAFQATARQRTEGGERALVATGKGRDVRDVPARLWALDAAGATLLWEEASPRAQVTDLRVVGDRVFIARFVDPRRVEGGWLEGDGLQAVGGGHMAMRQLPLAGDRLVLGSLYGEQPRTDGGLWLVADGEEQRLPSLRGVRALAAGDLDGDGDDELIVGDGWHASYGERAVARVHLLDGADLATSRTIALPAGDYAIREIELLGQGQRVALLATGSSAVHLLVRDDLGWADLPVGPVSETGNAVAARRHGGWDVVIAGDPALRVPVSW